MANFPRVKRERVQARPLQEKQPCLYLLASRPRGTLYLGVTANNVIAA